MTGSYDIAVVGGGFSGLMVVANIMRKKGPKPRIFWADMEPEWGFGLAYSTYESCHLLNVRADKMGAWTDGIDDFWRWVHNNHPNEYSQDSFVPRVLFGQYLAEIREAFPAVKLEEIKIKGARRHEGVWHLAAGKRTILAKNLVLATGNPTIAPLGWPDNDIYADNFWRWRIVDGGSAQRLPADGTVVIAGAGLTAADAMLGLFADGFKGKIICVSPHGDMPHIHAPVTAYDKLDPLLADLTAKPSSRNYMRAMRRHTKNNDWRSVIDSLRPHLTRLWQALDDKEKARFMRHLWSRWNIHRHRMAPEIAEKIEASGQVEIIAGRIIGAAEDGTVTIRPRGETQTRTIKAVKVLNCTGPSYRKMLDQNPLLASLKGGGHIKPGPLGLGIATPDAESGLYAIGTLLLGERLETTAVPELRAQAAEIAKALVA